MKRKEWKDPQSEMRGHELLTMELINAVPEYGHYEDALENGTMSSYDDAVVHIKLFSPYMGWTWFVTEWDSESGVPFGFVNGFFGELGSFSHQELAESNVRGLPEVERDLYFEPKTLAEAKKEIVLAR